jgi:hypothetical protein
MKRGRYQEKQEIKNRGIEKISSTSLKIKTEINIRDENCIPMKYAQFENSVFCESE